MGLRYGELFAGAGGLSLGLHRAGWHCSFHAEIDPFARRILTRRFPGVPLFGDVAELRGEDLLRHGPIDLLSGGSPCQDLSQAGLRAGLIDGERSNLFFQQVRLWKETGAPFLLWENVHGALSSPGKGKNGEDFRYVLSALVGADVGRAIDRKGRIVKWPGSGLVCGPAGRAAWRVLDAQYWGPPQRRRRVFVLAARPGCPSPEEVLFEWEGLFGHSATGAAAIEDATGDPRGGASEVRTSRSAGSGAGRALSFNSHSNGEDLSARRDYGVTPPLTAESEGTHAPAVVTYDARGYGDGQIVPTLVGDSMRRVTNHTPIVFDTKQSGESGEGVAPTLRAMAHDKTWMNGGGQLGVVNMAYPIQNSACTRTGENLTPTADAEGRVRIRPAGLGVGGPDDPMFTLTCAGPQHAVFAFDKAQITHPENRSVVEPGRPAPTLNSSGKVHVARMLAFGHYVEDGTASAMKARDYKDATDLVYAYENGEFGAPRRLMPVECERLMDWEDDWTAVSDASDSARYKVCGNGVVSACVEWIGLRLRARLEEPARKAA